MGVGDQIAGALPAADVAGGIGPGGAGQLALAAEKLQVDRRGQQPVARPAAARACAELGMHLAAGHEYLAGAGRVASVGRPGSRRPARS